MSADELPKEQESGVATAEAVDVDTETATDASNQCAAQSDETSDKPVESSTEPESEPDAESELNQEVDDTTAETVAANIDEPAESSTEPESERDAGGELNQEVDDTAAESVAANIDEPAESTTEPESTDQEVDDTTAEIDIIQDEIFAQDFVTNTEDVDTERGRIKAIIEAVIYITDEPLTPQQIAMALGRPLEQVKAILDELTAEYDRPDRGLNVRELAGGYKMATKPEHHEEIRAFVKNLKPPLKLSLAALETLAVIAYKQPITAPEIMEIRGVQGAGVLKTLIDRKLIATSGRKNVVGKPILYKTTKEFLVQFGLKDLTELPTLKEFEELGRLALSEGEPEALSAAESVQTTAQEPQPIDPPREKPPLQDPEPEEPEPDEPPEPDLPPVEEPPPPPEEPVPPIEDPTPIPGEPQPPVQEDE